MTDKLNQEAEELISWNPLVPGVPEVLLKPMKNKSEKPEGTRTIPIKVVRRAEITHVMKQEIMKILMNEKSSSGHEIRAALWLENQLDNACEKSDCHDVVRQVKKTYKSIPSRNEPPLIIKLSSSFWIDQKTLKLLMPVPGVYRLDKPGGMSRSIEFSDKMPSAEAIKAMEGSIKYDDFKKELPKEGGSLVSVDSQPAPSPLQMAGPMPSRDTKGRRKL